MTDSLDARNRQVGAALRDLGSEIPATMAALTSLHGAAFEGGDLDTKTKELMALAISVHAGCEDCIAFHLTRAEKAGAKRPEVLETLEVAVMMGGGPASVYAARTYAALGDEREAAS